MFTGIIEEIGRISHIVRHKDSATLTVLASKVLDGTRIGDSICVNGICLTVTTLLPNGFTADVMHETLNRSSLADARVNTKVNLERAMSANGRFGGHIVSGHVDGTGTITKIEQDSNAIWFTVQAPSSILRYIVEKSSITIDGISLTVAKVGSSDFAISAIPHTVTQTILKEKKIGSLVNLEADIIGKYIERFLTFQEKPSSRSTLTKEHLTLYGFL